MTKFTEYIGWVLIALVTIKDPSAFPITFAVYWVCAGGLAYYFGYRVRYFRQ